MSNDRPIIGVDLYLTGQTDNVGDRYEDGDVLYAFVPLTVGAVETKTTADGRRRAIKARATDIFILDDGRGAKMLEALGGARRKAEDAARGVEVLPGFDGLTDVGDVLDTDGSGIVLTPTEAADKAAANALAEQRSKATAEPELDYGAAITEADFDNLEVDGPRADGSYLLRFDGKAQVLDPGYLADAEAWLATYGELVDDAGLVPLYGVDYAFALEALDLADPEKLTALSELRADRAAAMMADAPVVDEVDFSGASIKDIVDALDAVEDPEGHRRLVERALVFERAHKGRKNLITALEAMAPSSSSEA